MIVRALHVAFLGALAVATIAALLHPVTGSVPPSAPQGGAEYELRSVHAAVVNDG